MCGRSDESLGTGHTDWGKGREEEESGGSINKLLPNFMFVILESSFF